jgi:hypothetical protein
MLSFYRKIRTVNTTFLPPPKAPAPQSGRTAEGSSGSGPVSGMKPKEEKLAGYLMAKAAMHQKVEGEGLKNLRSGHETMQQVGELLPLGRANVIQDVENSKDARLPLRKLAADTLMERLMADHFKRGGQASDVEYNAAIAASAQHAKTGTCGGFATNITAKHAAKLADMPDKRAVVSYTEHPTIDHAWSEMHPKGVTADGRPILHEKDVILDGWSKEKVAIFREDSHFARLDNNGGASHLRHDEPLNHVTGPEAMKSVEKFKAKIANSQYFQWVFNRAFNKLVAEKKEFPKNAFWNDTSVFHADFQGQAGKALHKDGGYPSPVPDADPVSAQAKRASLAEIQAVGVSRSLGSNVRGAKAEAPGIVATAKDMFPHGAPTGHQPS